MSCPCDQFVFPPDVAIPAGLTRLPRQTGTFADFRRAMLRAASLRSTARLDTHPLWSARYLTEPDRGGLARSLAAIGSWRGRHPEDFGVMLVEMWAYVCDLTSFYDDVLAHECYVRTARRRESLRKLVDLLGYVPRPAVGALADLAALADGRQAVVLPPGTAFRSGAFNGNPPQVFELDSQTTIHPLLNQWKLLPVRPATFGPAGAYRHGFLCQLGTVSVKAGDLVLVKIGTTAHAVTVGSVAARQGADGQAYTAVNLATAVWVPGHTSVSSVQILKPGATASLWTRTPGAFGPYYYSELSAGPDGTWFYLNSVSPVIRSGQDVIILKPGTRWAATIANINIAAIIIADATTVSTTDANGHVIAQTPVPAIYQDVTEIDVEPAVPGISAESISAGEAANVTVLHAFVSAGIVTVEALTEIDRTDSLEVPTPVEKPRDAEAPGTFQLEDKNGLGLDRPGSLNFATGNLSVQGDPWPRTLATPVNLFGNVVSASRGETVIGEWLGSGDAASANQSFTLKKNPLTYLPTPSETTPSGLTSTLRIYVDGLQWTEVPAFYGAGADAEIYIVRQNDKGESVVTFGDGVLGCRLSTGAQVIAYYRQGAGAAMPPAGSITQIARPVKGLKSVRNPVPAYGGADAEPAGSLQKFAPRSALLLGRAVSLADLEAAAAAFPGVRAVAVEWRWSTERQVPAAHVWYLADGDLTRLILQKLRGLAQPDTPIQVEPAVAAARVLSLQLTIDPKRFEDDVLKTARAALMDTDIGLLPPERLGIGKPLFRSALFEFVLQVPGVIGITGLTDGGLPFAEYGIKPDAGHYFDFTNGLILNGRTQ